MTESKKAPARASSLRIVVTGLIAQYPLGGVAWDYAQYPLGLHRMGHDVYYLEDTGQWPYNPREGGLSNRHQLNVRHLASVMERFGLSDRWAYRFPGSSEWYGMSRRQIDDVVSSADLLLNVSGTLARPEQYRGAARMVYIDSDPVFTQVKLARGQHELQKIVAAHDLHFSFGELLSDWLAPAGDPWLATRQPIVLEEWRHALDHRDCFTTVMNWTSYKPVVFQGRTYGQKDEEFHKIIDLPERVHPTRMELAVNAGKTRRTPRHLLVAKGWQVRDPEKVCPDLESYRRYVQTSKAEFSVAKNGYVQGKPGWFSGRSACYLASGRPVVVQDTGFDGVLPTGRGLLSFRSLDEAVAAVKSITAHYPSHCRAAQEIADAYFDSARVLEKLIEACFAPLSRINSSRTRS